MTKLPCLNLLVTAHSGLPQAGPKDRSGATGKPKGDRQKTLRTKFSSLSNSDLGLETTPPFKGSLWSSAGLLSLLRPQDHLFGPCHCRVTPESYERKGKSAEAKVEVQLQTWKSCDLHRDPKQKARPSPVCDLSPEVGRGLVPSNFAYLFPKQSCNLYYICHSLCTEGFEKHQKNRRVYQDSTQRRQWFETLYINFASVLLPFLFILHVAQAWLELSVPPRMSLNSWSLCLQLQGTGITGMYHHI